MAENKTLTPAYVPFKTFTSVLDSFSSFLPDRIDSSMWPSYSGGIKSQLMGALRFLNLIDDEGKPTQTLHALSSLSAEERPQAFRGAMKVAYGSLMSLDLTKATPASFDGEMRKYGQEGDTHRKAASFFLQAAKWSGVPLSPLLLKKGSLSGSRRKRAASTGAVKAKKGGAATPAASHQTIEQPVIGSEKVIILSDGSRLFLRTEKDLFRMNAEDRKFTMGLLDKIEEYEVLHPAEDDLEGDDDETED